MSKKFLVINVEKNDDGFYIKNCVSTLNEFVTSSDE